MRYMTPLLASVAASVLLSACHQSLADYENPDQPYSRQQICHQLSEILRGYDGPHDYKTKPISRARLAKYYNDYKLYGCEK